MFRIGQKVVCVNDVAHEVGKVYGNFHIVGDMHGLSKGGVYTIRGHQRLWYNGELGVYLREIHRPVCAVGYEVPYFVWRFRPVVEKSTDAGMAILREILDRESISDLGSPVTKAPSKDRELSPK